MRENSTVDTFPELAGLGRGEQWVLVNVRAARNAAGDVILHEGTIEDITARKLAQQQVNYLAYCDSLSGLPNRTLLRNRLNGALAAAGRLGHGVALLFLDLDRFKFINDSLGHSFATCFYNRLQLVSRMRSGSRTPWPGYAGTNF